MTGVTRLLDLSRDERKQFLDSFDHILTDLDFTVWNYVGPIDGVGQAVDALQKHNKKLVYISNNSIRSHENYLNKFKESHIDAVAMDNLMHPALAAIYHLKERNFHGLIYAIGSSEFKKYLRAAGFDVIDGPSEFLGENFDQLLDVVTEKQPVKAVIMDTDFSLNSTQLIRAQLFLSDPDCLFLVGTTDKMLPTGKGFKILGPGYYYKILEDATGRTASVVGKPGAALIDIVRSKYRLTDAKRVLFVGDTLEQDIGFGKENGFQTLLVLTGSARMADLESAKTMDTNLVPDYYLDSFADWSKVLEDL